MTDVWSGSYIEMDTVWPTSGRVRIFDLAQALEVGAPRHLNHPPFSFSLTKQHGELALPEGVSAAAELITTGGHSGTHVDALGHVSKNGKGFGGRSVMEGQSYAGGVQVGWIEETPPLIGRGHMLDLPRMLDRDAQADDCVGVEELERWFADRPLPERGSIVLIRTGWSRFWNDYVRFQGTHTGLPGLTIEGARWLSARQVAAVGSDTLILEKIWLGEEARP